MILTLWNAARLSMPVFLSLLCFGAFAQSESVKDTSAVTEPPYNTAAVLPLKKLNENDTVNRVPMRYVNAEPYISLQQLLKGNVSGVYIQEPSGEPGTQQNIFIRGISAPLLSKLELFDQQPAIYLNGIPLIQDNPFAYEVQKYDFNRIGTATNLLTGINANNIESIEIIKDPAVLAALGPVASNGAIWITTKRAHSGYREISINSYGGIVQKPRITPVNAAYDNMFRSRYYNKYASAEDRLIYPSYLRDSTNSDYYGPADWADLYYKNTPIYSADLSLTAGSDRANFRFFGSATKNAGNADKTSLDRYVGSFFINVAPISWLNVSSMINYSRLDRKRNRNIRDRLAEQRYIPDLTNPLTPNKKLYGSYLDEFDKVIDKNSNNAIQGYVAISAKYKGISYNGRIGFDYNEGIREAFWPTTLLEGNNYVSNYFGYNQRVVISNTIGYEFKLANEQTIAFVAGNNYMADVNKFDYAYAYNGPNNFIKINVVEGNTEYANYLEPVGFLPYYFPSKMMSKLTSFYGHATYSLKEILTGNVVVSQDGFSNMQPDNRWFTGYAGSIDWNIKKHLLKDYSPLSSLSLGVSASHSGKLLSDDRFNKGPQYRVDLGWGNEPTLGSYAGMPGISRPYTSGWVGYGIPWSLNNQENIAIRLGVLQDRLKFGVDLYNIQSKDMLFPVPVAEEWGYSNAYKSGMEVNNRGIDFTVQAIILPPTSSGFNWTFTGNLNYNTNKLEALPDGLNEVIIGENKFVVGKPIDAFWVLKNNGIYNLDSEVPTNPQDGTKLNYNGIDLKNGDPRWVDVNGDYTINDDDKVLEGNYMPKVFGGFGNTFSYKSFTLDMQFYFALGRKVLNQYASSRLDFINTDSKNDINSVKEITFWEKKQDLFQYPLYNPWSAVVPYRVDQDLFLDDASFLKLRSLSLSYDLTNKLNGKKGKNPFRMASIYITGTNLFTITSFKGDDPELAGYNGIYTGYGLPIPRSLILGLKIDL